MKELLDEGWTTRGIAWLAAGCPPITEWKYPMPDTPKLTSVPDTTAPQRKKDADYLRELADDVESGDVSEFVIVANCVRDHQFLSYASFKDRWRILGALEYAKSHFPRVE